MVRGSPAQVCGDRLERNRRAGVALLPCVPWLSQNSRRFSVSPAIARQPSMKNGRSGCACFCTLDGSRQSLVKPTLISSRRISSSSATWERRQMAAKRTPKWLLIRTPIVRNGVSYEPACQFGFQVEKRLPWRRSSFPRPAGIVNNWIHRVLL